MSSPPPSPGLSVESRFTWAVVCPSATQTAAYLESEFATAAARQIKCRKYLAVVLEATRSEWDHHDRWIAYLVEPTNRGPLPSTYLPIWPCALGDREPLRPDFDWPFEECVINTAISLFTPSSRNTRVSPRIVSKNDTARLNVLLPQDWETTNKKAAAEEKARMQAERAAAGFSGSAGSQWTTFSGDSTGLPIPPGELFPPNVKVSATVEYDLCGLPSAMDAFGTLEDWKTDERNIFRLLARFSDPSTENTIRWVLAMQARDHFGISATPQTISDLACLPFVELAARMKGPPSFDQVPQTELAVGSDDSKGSDADYDNNPFMWRNIAFNRVAEPLSFPPPPTFDSANIQVTYFDLYGTLIDKETGVFNALKPLLHRSVHRFDRNEALSFYLETELEARKHAPAAPYTEILAATYNDIALRLGMEPAAGESAAFAASLKHWPLTHDAEWCLATLRRFPSLALVAIADVDEEALHRTSAAAALLPYFHAVFTTSGPAVLEAPLAHYDALGVPRDRSCLVTSSILAGLEPARMLGLPTIWLRLQCSVMEKVVSVEGGWPEMVFASLSDLTVQFLPMEGMWTAERSETGEWGVPP